MDHNGIYAIPNNLPESLCKALIQKFENEPQYHMDGKLSKGPNIEQIDKSLKDSTEIAICQTPGWEKIGNMLAPFFEKGLDEYTEKYREMLRSKIGEDIDFVFNHNSFVPCDVRTPSIQRIDKGKCYTWHHDGGVLTYMWYLNTLKPEEGGETEFICGKKVKPEAGKLLFFPATWINLHTGRLVKGDAKYICVGNIYRGIHLK